MRLNEGSLRIYLLHRLGGRAIIIRIECARQWWLSRTVKKLFVSQGDVFCQLPLGCSILDHLTLIKVKRAAARPPGSCSSYY